MHGASEDPTKTKTIALNATATSSPPHTASIDADPPTEAASQETGSPAACTSKASPKAADEDESEEDFLDSVLSAYIRNDDGDNRYSLNLSSGSDYGEFDDIDLCGGGPDRDPASGKPPGANANVKGLLPPRKKFLSPVRVVHPGFAI